jgi:hypothetical protein
MKILSRLLIAILLFHGYMQCSEDLPGCPGKMCIISGSWKLTSVFYDDEQDFGDYSNYRLMLHYPEPANGTTSDFERIQPAGNQDAGSWSIESNGSVLRLVPKENATLTEDWVIERFSPRELVLILHRDGGIKDGPSTIRLRLEPFI